MSINQIQILISLVPIAYVAGMAIPVLIIDLKEHRVPNKVVMPLLLLTLLCWLTLAVWQGKWAELGLSVLVFLGLMFMGIILNYFDWLGMGDVKCMATLGLIIAWFSVPASLIFPLIVFGLSLFIVFGALLLDAIGLINLDRTKTVPLYPYIIVAFGIMMSFIIK